MTYLDINRRGIGVWQGKYEKGKKIQIKKCCVSSCLHTCFITKISVQNQHYTGHAVEQGKQGDSLRKNTK